ncbi:ATP-binding protein [Vibrio fluvialis]|uniref:sensor histidine kinase n=1 Tax=Vibrio fluvialis TaxID=676 RepID=UPI000CEB4170|nr:sensor histidine kinase [Vibrio fluvialis]AVH33415.1 ATP-binding protein [Vibrio fluvialis]MBY8066262.1 ATP-binding protein [Vibrio fluvialis]
MSNKTQLKRQLAKLVEGDDDNLEYGEILNIASQLSEYDEQNVRFSVDGNLVKRLGEQLVAKKTTALAELIKNAYDAEATTVDVIFENTEVTNGTITIVDNGNGMTREALIKGFMTISTSDKEDNPVSPVLLRPRAGRKGIGRFSAQKIGNNLRIITRTTPDAPYLVVDINWEDYQAKTNLLAISNSIQESHEDFGFEKGTKLIISNTKEVWNEQNHTTTFKYISTVIKSSPQPLPSGVIDPGFKPRFYTYLPISKELIEFKSDDTEFLSEADAKISAEISDNGEIIVKIKGIKSVKDVNIDDTYTLKEIPSKALKKAQFKFSAHYFTLSSDSGNVHLKSYTRENGGIKLYRNGFYVAPYGSRYDDWLSLDDSVRRRRILPPHSNTNFIGCIDISDIDGDLFDETSSREGLIENTYFEELRNTAYEIITSAVKRIASARGKKVTSSQQGYKKPTTTEERLETTNDEITDALSDLTTASKESLEREQQSLGLFPEVKEPINQVNEEKVIKLKEKFDEQQKLIQDLIDEKNMYRVLSSTGLAIAEFTHEIQLYLNALALSGKQLKRSVVGNEKALKSANKIDSHINMLVSYSDFFTSTIRNNSNRIKEPLELREVIQSFFEAMSPTINRRSYELTTSFQGDDFWTKPIHISELSSVLMNLFTNACKAIIRSNSPKGMLKVTVSSTDTDHVLRFEDNGDGIPEDHWGKVFNPLFTTEVSSGAYTSEELQMKGMGLGLTISQDIVEGFDGEINVVKASENFSTCIQVIIPKADESEVPQDVY